MRCAVRLRWLYRLVWFGLVLSLPVCAQLRVPAAGELAELRARQQRLEGTVYHAEGDVEIRYGDLELRADRLQYDTGTGELVADGNIRFTQQDQHLEAETIHYNLKTGRGRLQGVRGSIRFQREPSPVLLVSVHPLYFEAREVERTGTRSFVVRDAWLTVCEPERPKWQFFAPEARIELGDKVVLLHANFRIFRIPLIYLPYATAPIAERPRQSGFLIPTVGNKSQKGFVLGNSFYWAPADWADLTLGVEWMSRRGFGHLGEMRLWPWEQVRVNASYFAVLDRGLATLGGTRIKQGGYQSRFELDAHLPHGWRAVADVNQLSSLTFRLVFAETFDQAARSEVRSTASLTNNFRGFSLGFAMRRYKNFLSAVPEQAVVLRTAPGARFSSVEQAPWRRVPIYFGFHAAVDAVHRSDPLLETPEAVQRSELAPRVTIPLRWGPWLGVRSTVLLRTTRYSISQDPAVGGGLSGAPVRRTTAEVTVDARPPALARIWEGTRTKWKHVIAPGIVYRYVNGVNQFGRFLRFDENDLLTDTNEVEYGIVQRLYRRSGTETTEWLSWRVAQKYYLDKTFGGALVPGRRNVFAALYSITPFAFADQPRRFSPLVSDLKVTPGGAYDAQFRVDYDPTRRKLTAVGTLVKLRPRGEAFLTLAHFATRADPVLQPLSNQIRALVGYGELARRGFNFAFGLSYDVNRDFFQNTVVQVSYNGACCGIGFEYRRLALGPVRSDNQFRVSLLIANLGTVGTVRRRETIF
ncbi:MAG: LPS assembly protein LptD [Firmicutes bacterium]|nr:LPS assembly protein LptD [Bacillota bacterium]